MIINKLVRQFRLSARFASESNMPFYAVRAGKTPGVYKTWSECEAQVKGFSKPKYKKFVTEAEALSFVKGNDCVTTKGGESSASAADQDAVEVYIHGCCHYTKGDPKSGIGIFWGENSKDNVSGRIDGAKQSINRAEICAATKAIQLAKEKGIKHLVIHSENQYMINCASQWMEKWKKNDWKQSKGEEVTNKDDLMELDAVMSAEDIKITFIHLDGDAKNESSAVAAKKLAGAGTKNAEVERVGAASRGIEITSQKRSYSTDSNSSNTESSKKSKMAPSDIISDAVSVYTDGCCHSNGKGQEARAGIGVYWGPDHPNNISEKLAGRQTNNRAEILAAKKAIDQAKAEGIKHLAVHTDSQFLIDCVTKWMPKWKENGWKKSKGEDVMNREELEELDKTSQGIKVTYIHVDGHSGIDGNEAADKLANAGARK